MKKVLIICYYWPPAGGPGVQRWLKFVKYLRDYNIEPLVYVPENPSYPIVDPSLIKEIPEGITVLKHPISEPYALAKLFSKKDTETISSGIIDEKEKQTFFQKLMLYIRGNFFIPDARKFWVKPSVKFLTQYLKKNQIDVIITTGPPHSLHLIGLKLKEDLSLPWIADFRDPWTSIGYHDKLKLNKRSERKHNKLEKQVLEGADHILTTSPTTTADFEKLTNVPITCITNGFDEEYFEAVDLDTEFSLSHIGSLLSDRNPKMLWQVLQEIKREQPQFDKDLKLKLAGRVSNSVVKTIKEYGLEKNLELVGYLSHPKALIAQRTTQVLLLIEINAKDTQAIIPGKVFEYLAAKRPILGIGPDDSDFFEIVSATNSGTCFTYFEKTALKDHILSLYKNYKEIGLASNTSKISQYSRKALTEKLAFVINDLIDEKSQ